MGHVPLGNVYQGQGPISLNCLRRSAGRIRAPAPCPRKANMRLTPGAGAKLRMHAARGRSALPGHRLLCVHIRHAVLDTGARARGSQDSAGTQLRAEAATSLHPHRPFGALRGRRAPRPRFRGAADFARPAHAQGACIAQNKKAPCAVELALHALNLEIGAAK